MDGTVTTDALALYSLYLSAGGARWITNNWPTTAPSTTGTAVVSPCGWLGVSCDAASGRVVYVFR